MLLRVKTIWPENFEVFYTKCAGRYHAYQLMYVKNNRPGIVHSFEAKDYSAITNFVSNNDDITPIRLIVALD